MLNNWLDKVMPAEGTWEHLLLRIAWVALRIVALLLLGTSASTFVYQGF